MLTPNRNLAVDVFRGLTLAFMVLVNNPGDYLHVYRNLKHSPWHGWTPVDLVFPCFLFIVGVSLSMGLDAKLARGWSQERILVQSARRCLILIVLGLFDNAYPYFVLGTLRWPGVLQRIGIISVLTTLVLLRFSPRVVIRIIVLVLLAYWAILTLAPVPWIGPPDLSLTSVNLPAWLDNKILRGHLWLEDNWDPEGILSTFPSLCITLFGAMAAKRLAKDQAPLASARRFAAYGALLLVSSAVWDVWLPINRWLWTSSFIVMVSGWAYLILAVCLVAQEKLPHWSQTPFKVYGANAITLYLGSSLLSKTIYIIRFQDGLSLHALIHDALFTPWLSPDNASLAWALAYTLVFLGLGWALYARGIYIKA